MKKMIFVIGAIACFLSFFPEAGAVSLRLLAENPQLYEGREIEVTAEVLDQLPQAKGTWLNVSDETASTGVWVDREIRLPEITYAGSYNVKGDTLRVKGTFRSSCQQHLGQMDIHAKEITLVARGGQIKEEVAVGKKQLALAWLVFFAIVFVIYIAKIMLAKARPRPSA